MNLSSAMEQQKAEVKLEVMANHLLNEEKGLLCRVLGNPVLHLWSSKSRFPVLLPLGHRVHFQVSWVSAVQQEKLAWALTALSPCHLKGNQLSPLWSAVFLGKNRINILESLSTHILSDLWETNQSPLTMFDPQEQFSLSQQFGGQTTDNLLSGQRHERSHKMHETFEPAPFWK